MKNLNTLFFALFIILFLDACAGKNSQNLGVVELSQPVFISEFPTDKTAFVNFTNTSNFDSNLTKALSFNLQKAGYKLSDENAANFVIKGNLNYFRRKIVKDPNPFYGSVGFGFGGYRYSGIGVGMGFPVYFNDDDYDYRTNSYIYDAQVSLLIRIKNNENTKDYTTNLNYQTGRNLNGTSSITDEFNAQISKIILQILKTE